MTNYGCNSCGPRGFGRRVNPQAAKAMRLWRSGQAKDLAAGWAMVRSGKGSRRSRSRRGRKHRGSRRRRSRSRRRRSRSRKRRSRSRKGRKRRSRRFGIVAGPGFNAQTSYSNAYAPYFGASEPFVNPSEWFLPVTNGQIQSPQMLYKNSGFNRGPGN